MIRSKFLAVPVVLAFGLLGGCVTSSELAAVKATADHADQAAAAAQTSANSANAAAAAAAQKAADAQASANSVAAKLEQHIQSDRELNDKVDNMFKKSMEK